MKTSEYLTITPNGDVLGAPVFTSIKPIHYGNIHNNNEDELLNNQIRVKHTAYEKIGRFIGSECISCEYYSECKGGFSCVPINDGSGECIGMKSIQKEVEKYREKYKLNNNLWNPSPQIPELLFSEIEPPCDKLCHKCKEFDCEDRV